MSPLSPFTGESSSQLVGNYPAKKDTAPEVINLIAGEARRFDVMVRNGSGAPFPMIGSLESARVIFSIRDASRGLLLARECTPFLRQLGRFFLQLNEIDTSSVASGALWDLWVILPDGNEVPLSGPRRLVIANGAHHFLDISTVRPSTPVVPPATLSSVPPRIGLGRPSWSPTRVMSIGDSISAGGVIATAALGGWQWWFQHFCNLYGKDIVWVGPAGLSDASPPSNIPIHVDGIPWSVANAGFSGATIENMSSPQVTLGIRPYYDGTVATYIQQYQPDIMLPMIGTNDLQATKQNQTSAATLTRFQALMGIWQTAIGSLGKTCHVIEGTVIPPGKTFTTTPAYPGYWTSQFEVYRDALVTYLGTLGGTVRVADHYRRFVDFIGYFGENYSGSTNYDASEMATPSSLYTSPTGEQIPYTAVGEATAGAVTVGLVTDGLHPNWNNGFRLMAEQWFGASYDLLANKI